ncbi:dsRBD fold-containing protein [Nonomuraea polychroma]|uniref:Uncharacterized protein DUF1876 n=1 Tax=Nonomuraea polychroma TaxID=46176 RepID=A0A438MP26_9ACTN|nr:dsRBD fold-containing protein [Nonomuraea polychroma]RVX47642.1 uncharacterized protein DUF1876 [Nonomuraea polychroma]
MAGKEWSIQIDIAESGDLATAYVTLTSPADVRLTGCGEAHRNPADPPAPRIGEELAVGRALIDLTGKLLGVATNDVRENVRSAH